MRIDPNSGTTAAESAAAGRDAKASAQTTAPTRAAERTRDPAEFSPAQSRAATLAAQVNQLPDVRKEKVAALASAISKGSYRVSPEQTADAILSQLRGRSEAAA